MEVPMTERSILMSDLERQWLEHCHAEEMRKVTWRNANAPHNHPDRIAARASDNAKAMMRLLEARAA
jgi:hypothetical protein